MNFTKCLLASLFLFCSLSFSHAQFVKGVGATIGLTYSTQKWRVTDTTLTQQEKYKFGFNGSVFVEMIDHDYWRWISEIEFNRKGVKEVIAGQGKFRNRTDYISWNNYIKLREEEITTTPYLIAGPRIEYRFATRPQIFPDIIHAFNPWHISFAAGFGMEFISNDPYIFFAEFIYNPDIMNAYQNPSDHDMRIKNKALELRVGFKYAITRHEICP